jgi:hypothetical protein
MVPTTRPRKSRLVVTSHPHVSTTGELMAPHSSDPTVLWRLTRGQSSAHATIFPGADQTTVTWFFDDVMDRAENYDSIELAMARADEIKGVLVRGGWKEG